METHSVETFQTFPFNVCLGKVDSTSLGLSTPLLSKCHIQSVAVSKSKHAVYGLRHVLFCMFASKSNHGLGLLSAIALTLHYIESYTESSRQAVYRLFLPKPSTL